MANELFRVEDYAGVLVVKFVEHALLESMRIEQLGQGLYTLAEQGEKRRLVIDFTAVRSLSSHMLGILLKLRGKLADKQGSMALCGLRPELMKVFTITCLDKVFRFFPNDAEALASFGVRVMEMKKEREDLTP